MTPNETNENFVRAIILLDAAQEALDAAAVREMAREKGKTLRCITAQKRAKTVREFVVEMAKRYGIPL